MLSFKATPVQWVCQQRTYMNVNTDVISQGVYCASTVTGSRSFGGTKKGRKLLQSEPTLGFASWHVLTA